MCGISGFLSAGSSQEHLHVMTDCLAHRGPDAKGYYFDSKDAIGLGHRRLSILDLSEAGNQPFYSSNRRYIMVYNGEVYNFRDLAKKYGLHVRTGTDTEVILELFSSYGPAIVEEFNGMFAMAIWDDQDKELFIFRDRFGVKPLFYQRVGDQLFFSSELKGLRKKNVAPPEIDHSRLGYFLHLGFIPFPHTIYRDIFKLPPGKYIQFKAGRFEIKQFVSLSQFVTDRVVVDEKEALENIDQLLMKAVERQNIADVPVGVFLSGGTDSSILAALTKKISDKKVQTFSVGFENSMFDELPYAAAVAKFLGTEHHEIQVTSKQMLDNLYEIIDAYDEPYIIAAGFPAFAISAFTSKHVKVALSGEGADEMFMGYGFHSWAQRMDQFPLKQLGGLIGMGLRMSPNIIHQQKGRLFQNSKKYSPQSHIFSEEQYYFSIDEIGKNFALRDGYTQLQNEKLSLPEGRKFNAEEAQAWFDINVSLVDDLLPKVDRASMHYGLEVRVPFLDNDLFAYVMNVDSKLKLNNGNGKYILKKLLHKYVPAEYFNRRKWGFAPPLAKWLRSELKHVVDQYLDPAMIRKYGVVDEAYVMNLKREYYAGSERKFNKLWLLVLLHIWLERNA
jgi:asparagine synthase (glutamine-hydrolysing)